ncbi:MAG: AAA family ATPase [Halobacteriovoraceae bacterium]|nr:AAA family ATPase [Halobacteriovoraceae bacterium]
MKKLPIGIQSIKKILSNNDYVYVDKTGFVKQLIDAGTPHYFLSRPRRFGKSLFINTLEEVLSGNKELFKGLKIYKSNHDWEKFPVVHLDFSKIANRTSEQLEKAIKNRLKIIAKRNNVSIITDDVEVALDTLITGLSEKIGSQVVVLIDEYDKPIIDRLDNLETAQKNKDILKGFFGTLKALDDYLKLTFITGISKFSHVSLFSGLNNLNDITMDSEYAGIMGYTEEEVQGAFSDHVQLIANERHEASVTPVLEEIKNWYNGYRFSKSNICVYNPFSTLNFMNKKHLGGYWYSTGTPSFLIDELKKHPQSMISLDGATAREDELTDISSLEEIDLKALMYQTGYFTIKEYNPISNRYHLGLPNEEVRTAFMNSLVKNFTSNVDVRSSEKFVKALEKHHINVLFDQVKLGFSSFAYQVFAGAKERTYQAMLLSMLYGMGFEPLSEQPTNTGRIDVVLEMQKTTYILELKLDSNPEIALDQIRKKEYFTPYMNKGKEVAIIGANFSSEKRNISDWKGELLSESGKFLRTINHEKI